LPAAKLGKPLARKHPLTIGVMCGLAGKIDLRAAARACGWAAITLWVDAGGAWLGHSGAYDFGCAWHSACCRRLIGRLIMAAGPPQTKNYRPKPKIIAPNQKLSPQTKNYQRKERHEFFVVTGLAWPYF